MTRISTQTLELMPNIEQTKRISQSAAMLDAILCPDWESRYFSFNARWNKQTMMASMQNGAGDDYFMTFSSAGAILKGFDHESAMSPYAQAEERVWVGVLENIPEEFADFLKEPAFKLEDTTYCIWRLTTDTRWHCGSIEFPTQKHANDGSSTFLWIFDGLPETYQKWAKDYYETIVSIAAVRHVYAHQTLTTAIIQKLNPELELSDLKEDILEIGYPTSNFQEIQ
jgi:hypothetical protein